jgi:hypothetical protein
MFPSLGENAIDISAGHQDYLLGSGFLLYDGGGDGGERGAWWIGARTAFKNTLIARINTGDFKFEAFHLETRPRRASQKSIYDGINLEYQYKDRVNIGFSYIYLSQDFVNEGANVYDTRISFMPFTESLPNLSLTGEYVYQQGKQNFRSQGGYGQISYHFKEILWQPKLRYRYSALEDDFNGMAYGFSGWGTWYQGEITGEYFFAQTNILTHLFSINFTPLTDVDVHLMYYHFELDNSRRLDGLLPQIPTVTSSHYGDEINLIADWKVNDTLLLTGTLATFIPGNAAKQVFLGGNKTWVQAMFYASFKF